MILNGKKVDTKSIEVDVNKKDYPDFCDSFITYAEFEDGTLLTDEEIDQLENEYPTEVYDLFYESYLF